MSRPVVASRPVAARPVAAPALSVAEVLPWLVLAVALAALALFFVGAEQGALAVFSGTGVHEWVHDGRHLLGFPCH